MAAVLAEERVLVPAAEVSQPQAAPSPLEKSPSTAILCNTCGNVCKGEVLRVQNKYFHIKCFVCKGERPRPLAAWPRPRSLAPPPKPGPAPRQSGPAPRSLAPQTGLPAAIPGPQNVPGKLRLGLGYPRTLQGQSS
ncbi:hypothetical protein P7K49_006028 [Saguinus oedipus]|uniref:Actin-binding LIM protein 2 n=1 Tax=Saguinus oedipus TaxID=9490 RepID=A0ABQ9W4T8_SAGOE|nr:hypothetical protein P7K49_006028 [Saguinus oedipus]